MKSPCGLVVLLLVATLLPAAEEPTMRAHFINMGQANSTLLEFPCGAVLIDAGAQDDVFELRLINYLNAFFNRRPDLNKTLQSIIITHNHIDHTKALILAANEFKVRRYIDNGQLTGRGTEGPRWIRANAVAKNIKVIEIKDSQVPVDGWTNDDIDPVACPQCDPKLRVLSGRKPEDIDWPEGEFDNKNNHSIVVRLDYGHHSFLFTGDMEEIALDDLVHKYHGTGLLNVDLYEVGHHGSRNATTPELLEEMTPLVAVISMGHWDFGLNSNNRFTTYAYGHPRKDIINMLAKAIPNSRKRIQAKVATKAKTFESYRISKAIFATGWDGNIVATVPLNGDMLIDTKQ